MWKNGLENLRHPKKCNALVVFDMIADMISNKKNLRTKVTELFIRERKLNILSHNLISKYKFFIVKIPNKQELQQIAFKHSTDIDFKNFMNLMDFYKKVTQIIFFFSDWYYICIR